MASSYSKLKIELIGTGEQVGTWGSTTNTNFEYAVEEAIIGSADVTFASADVDLTLTNSNATQTARNYRLNLTGTSGGARNLYLSTGANITKPYIINNGLADSVTVRNKIGGTPSGSSVVVPAGKTMMVYNTGINIVEVQNYTAVASGGTGLSTLTADNVILGNGTSPVQFVAPGSSGNVLRSTGTTWASGAVPAGGTTGQVQFNSSGNLLGNSSFTYNAGTGAVTATSFNGSGAGLTSIPNSATTATSTNTGSAIVARDASGNFSAGTITATLNGNASTATTASSASTATSATTATTATNIAGGAANRIPYNTGSGSTSFITAPTTDNTFLKYSSGVFTWDASGVAGVTSVTSSTPTTIGVSGSTAVSISLTGTNVTNALGYTPYPNTNPNGYVTSSALSGYAQLSGTNNWTSPNTFSSYAYFNPSNVAGANLVVGASTAPSILWNAYIKGQAGHPSIVLDGTNTSAGSAGGAVLVNSVSNYLFGFFYGTLPSSYVTVGYITSNGTGVSYGTASDYRLKENVQPLANSIGRLKQLNPINYLWKADPALGTQEGFLAHELQAVIPEAVNGQKDAVDAQGNIRPQQVDLSYVVPLLTKALQEAVSRIETLEAEVQILKGA